MVLPMDFYLTISSIYESDDSLDQEHDEDSLSSLNSDRSTSLESDMVFQHCLAGSEFSRFLIG